MKYTSAIRKRFLISTSSIAMHVELSQDCLEKRNSQDRVACMYFSCTSTVLFLCIQLWESPHVMLLVWWASIFFVSQTPRFTWHSEQMVFCYLNCSDLLWEKIVLVIKKNFEIRGWKQRYTYRVLQTIQMKVILL